MNKNDVIVYEYESSHWNWTGLYGKNIDVFSRNTKIAKCFCDQIQYLEGVLFSESIA